MTPATPTRLPDRTIALDEALPGFVHRDVEVPGGSVHVVSGGRGPDTVVLLAGFPQTWWAWHDVMPLLAGHHRVIALDLPGQGLSSRFDGAADTTAAAGHLHDAIAQLVDGRYWLVGHDVGSWVAFSYALLHADELAGLALLDAGIPGATLPESVSLHPDRVQKLWHFAFHQVAELPEVLLAGREHDYVDWFLRAKHADPTRVNPADVDLYARALQREGGLGAALSHYRHADRSARRNRALLAELGPITVPILAVDSEHGSIPDMAGPLAPFAQRISRATIDGAGHFIPEERPDRTAEVLLQFFDDTQGPERS